MPEVRSFAHVVLALALTLGPASLLPGCGDRAPGPGGRSEASREAVGGRASGLRPGRHRIVITHDSVHIEANEAPLSAVLDEIALRMGVAVTIADANRDVPVTVDAEAPGLPGVLPALLRGLDFHADYEPFGADAVRVVSIGVGPLPKTRSGSALPGATALRESARSPSAHGFDDEPADEDDAEELSEREALARLARGSRDERVAAIRFIEAEGEGLRALMDVLADDGDPAVRAAAAEQLEDAQGFAGVQALIRALQDPDVGVVRAAIESLEFAGDESVIVHLQPLLDHPDPDVRHDAEDAIEFLRD